MEQKHTRPRGRSLPAENEHSAKAPLLCGLVLAGGEGKRLRSFIHLLRQDLLPKQYVNFIGRRSMLEHALHRAERLIPPRRVFTIINRRHLEFPAVQRQISGRPPQTVIVQPENKETGPGILLSLAHIVKRHPNAVVALLPSDHFVLEEQDLMRHVRRAYLLVKRDPSQILLLGIKPNHEESEYGYILPGTKLSGSGKMDVYGITRFIEKPQCHEVRNLMLNGALWSTMMMVFAPDTLWEQIQRVSPELCDSFRTIYEAIGTIAETTVVQEIYKRLPPVNFSKELLEPLAQNQLTDLRVVPVRDVVWSDWGSEVRVMEVLRKTGYASRLNGLRSPHQVTIKPAQTPLSEELPKQHVKIGPLRNTVTL